ncbi:MAG: hypothetical protein JNN30_22385 [Rhodanobacteraceae bacterium]|nr:hypothetical protein [Rhodanobacteraceae bacterium]
MGGKIRNAIVATLNEITSSSVRARIDDERKRLDQEGEREKQLEAARIPLLECGADEELDRVEASINESRAAQIRIQERLELLNTRLSDREQAEERQRLATLRERTDRLREFGESIIREDYAKAAGALADALRRLRAVDYIIEDANLTLARAGIECVVPTNAIRCKRSRTETVTRKRRVGLGEPTHPYYGRARIPYNSLTGADGLTLNPETRADNGDLTHVYVDIEETIQEHHTAEIQQVLHQAIGTLPSASDSSAPIYDVNSPVDDALLNQMRADFGL